MKISLDVMSGDNAPHSTMEGASLALSEYSDIEIVLVGDEKIIEENIIKYNIPRDRVEIVHAYEVIDMNDDPIVAVKSKKNSSMNLALDCTKKGLSQATVSSGNTGALLTSSQLRLKRIKGVLRPAIASIFPNKQKPMVMLDLGATADTKPEFLNQFALMGSKYMEVLFGCKEPRVALLNIGEETGKGNELTRSAYTLLENNNKINFIGNIESHKIFDCDADVVVTDGFTGNIVLKTSEGIGSLIFTEIKESVKINFIHKCGAFLMKNIFKKMKKDFDSSEYGGAIFLGLNGISIKAHGGSNALGIKNAIRVANLFASRNFVQELKNTIENI